MNITEFKSSESMTAHLADCIITRLARAIVNHGKASLLVSGGKSPIALFKRLSKQSLAWSEVTISLVDDRWLGPEHRDSNELLVRTHLLVNNAAAATFVPLIGVEDSAEDGVAAAIERVNALGNNIDVMVLGMGEDGHTASIFPCCAEVSAAMASDNKLPLIVTNPTMAPYQRISFTLNQILAAKQVYLPLSGDNKLAVFEQATVLENNQEMPISAVIQQHQALDVLICRSV